MKKLACSLLITIFLASSIFFVSNVHASSTIGGLITSDTTWSANNSPYQFTGPVGVPSSVTLTIEPGVTVDFGNYYLLINGTLNARGTAANNIYLTTDAQGSNPLQQIQFNPSSTSWNDQTNSGCIVENIVFNQVSIVVKGCSPKISSNVFNSPFWMAVLSQGGSPSITDNVIQNVGAEGVSVGNTSIVTNNLFNGTNGEFTPTAIVTHNNAYVSNNKIVGYWNGITADDQATVKGNVILNCSNAGISSLSSNENVQSNYVAYNHIGISGSGNIQNNAIVNNAIGIQIQSSLTSSSIINNNIVGNTQNSVVLTINTNFDLSNNWWGTTDTQTINQTIRDFKNDFNLGVVSFIPVLDQPSSAAPTSADINLGQLPASESTSQPKQDSNSQTSPAGQSPQTTSLTPNSLGAVSRSSDDPLAHLNIIEVVEIALIAVGIAWVIGILTYVNRKSKKKIVKKAKRRKSTKQKEAI